MHNRWIFVVAALLLAAAVGLMSYNAGIAHGIAQSGKIAAPAPGAGPYPYPYPYPYYYGWHPFGFGFFFAPFFFFLFFIFIARGLFWRGHHWHHHGCAYRHEQQPEGGAPQQ